jgi:uncharacterized protein YbaA (DUF1428 family)
MKVLKSKAKEEEEEEVVLLHLVMKRRKKKRKGIGKSSFSCPRLTTRRRRMTFPIFTTTSYLFACLGAVYCATLVCDYSI